MLNTGCGLIERIAEFKPEIILLDGQPGHMDGRVVCKQIKELEEHSTTPVILFSVNIYFAKNVKEYLCDDFIEKPFEVISLIEIIEKHIQFLNWQIISYYLV